MRNGRRRGSDELNDRISHTVARAARAKRECARINLPDVRRYRREGLVAQSLLPLAQIAEDETRGLLESLGGAESVSEQERALIEDVARVGLILRAEMALYLGGQREAGVRVGTLASIRRASLVALGLGRRSKEIALEDYIEAKARKAKP